MKRIATANRAIDLFGAGKDGFRAAVPGVSDATYLSALMFNHMQESVMRTIEQAGLVPSDTDFDQFVTALNSLYAKRLKISVITLPATLTAAAIGMECILGGAGSLALPVANTLSSGDVISIFNTTLASVTLSRAGTDQIAVNGGAYTNSIVIAAGETAILASNGTSLWYLTGGSCQLKYGAMFASLLNGNGWRYLPSGDIEQWGSLNVNVTGANALITIPVVFPIAFPNACLVVGATLSNCPINYLNASSEAPSSSGFSLIVASGTVSSFNIKWRAIGK